ncbi:MAG: chorismate synthase [Lachnospiraceae bacterium]|nr:chorismate synthase [Lachnospiraceae bacterium]
MAGSITGNIIRVSTWGESHGAALGCVIDGVPAGLVLNEELIQPFMDRRAPGTRAFSTARAEGDKVRILSGVFEGKTTGTPVSLMVENKDQRSKDYGNIATSYRPGHADFTFDQKYGFRDYRGGGRSSGRETIGRVAAGAVCELILKELGVSVNAYTYSIGPVKIDKDNFDIRKSLTDPLSMPDEAASEKAMAYLKELSEKGDSAGGVIECVIKGLPAGIGEPVFDKLDASLAKAVLSIGAVKGFEIGSGFEAANLTGSVNNDSFFNDNGKIGKRTNNAGGILGGISDGSDIVFRAAVKPTPSVSIPQETVDNTGRDMTLEIKGRHDNVIVPRAVVVVESMAAITVLDLMLMNMSSRLDGIKAFYVYNRRQ